MSRRTRARRNASISKVWDTLRMAQRFHVLRAAGVDEERARIFCADEWTDLAVEMKGLLLAGWQMGVIGGTTRRSYKKGDTTKRMPVMTNPGDWRVTHDGETLKAGLESDGKAMAWLLRHQSQSVDFAVKYSGYDIVCVEGGKVKWSWKRDGMKGKNMTLRNLGAKHFEFEGSHTYATTSKGGGWHIYETYKTYDDALDWAKFIMKQGIPGVPGNVQALILRPTGERSYSVYWRRTWKVSSNPVPIWMQSDEAFQRVVGVSIKEWQRIFKALPDWKKKEFHRRAGKKILSANAMKWVVEQGAPSLLKNRPQVPIEVRGETQAMRLSGFLRKRGVRIQIKRVKDRSGWFTFYVPSSQAELAENLLYKWMHEADPYERPVKKALASERRWKIRQRRRQHRRGIRRGGYMLGGKTITADRRLPNPRKVWYVGMYKTSRGLAWWTSESRATLEKKPIVGKILKISAPTSSKAIEEAWKHRRRLGL